MTPVSATLHQFPYSHFNEKARWALEWKRVPHRRVSHLPGPHMRAIKKLSGQTATPVLDLGGEIVAGSAQIIDALEQRFPEAALYPEDLEQRERALEIQRWFDAEIGSKVRRALFSVMLGEPGYLCAMFSTGHSAPARAFYRAAFPLARGLIRKGNGVTSQAAIDEGFEGTRSGFEFVAKHAGPSGHLVGDRFSVADLTAAALLAPAVNPGHPDMRKPEPIPAGMRGFLARWAEHPGAAWVIGQYERNRPTGAGV